LEKGERVPVKSSSSSSSAVKVALKNVVRGKLALKGAKTDTHRGKLQKRVEDDAEKQLTVAQQRKEPEKGISSEPKKTTRVSLPEEADKRTETEKAFERAQHIREQRVIRHRIAKTHRQRIEEFNNQLSNLSEHYDIPRVGPG